jgi:hypothetical protein
MGEAGGHQWCRTRPPLLSVAWSTSRAPEWGPLHPLAVDRRCTSLPIGRSGRNHEPLLSRAALPAGQGHRSHPGETGHNGAVPDDELDEAT